MHDRVEGPFDEQGGEKSGWRLIHAPKLAEMLASRGRATYITNMHKKRILFIDDEDLLREVIYEMLTEMDYEVKVEETGAEAIKTVTEHPEQFDLVLTDLLMLDMTGDEIAEKIRSIRPDLPVVVMTGTPQNLPPGKAAKAGVCKVLPKPLTKAELSEGIRGALSNHC